MVRISISLITAAFLIAVVLIAGMAGHVSPSQNLEIRTWYDLDAVRNNLSGNYTLMNDFDSITAGYEELASPTANEGKGWEPIGTDDSPFNGTFDGQEYEIKDLFIDRPTENFVGLFASISTGFIQNLGVVNATLRGNCCVGSLTGHNYDGTVNNLHVTGSISGWKQVGGLIGCNANGTVSNCYATGYVTGAIEAIGGLVGQNWDGIVSNCYATGNVSGTWSVGGLVGWNHGTVIDSHSTSSVFGQSSIGGLVGASAGTISDSYAKGSVTGSSQVGGLVGFSWGTVGSCYSIGSVTGNYGVGGLMGDNEGTVSKSFWDTETSGQATSAGGMGKTTAEMQDIATFSGVGWNITAVANPGMSNPSSIWNIVDDLTYPFLSWQS
jgi:hypothetical protein